MTLDIAPRAPGLRPRRGAFGLALPAALLLASAAGAQPAPTAYQALGREVLRDLVGTNTTYSSGSTTKAAELMAARFRAAGFPAGDVMVVGPDTGSDAKDRNLVVRYRGSGRRRPVLLIGHLDVVEARRSDWVLDPFALTERDGYFYGRGTLDMKGGDAAWVAALLRMKQEGVVPAGDYVLLLTAGEEGGGGYNGIQWLLERHRALFDVEYVLNPDTWANDRRDGKARSLAIQAAEKVFLALTLTARNPGGHSSVPVRDNAIDRVAAALGRVAAHEFPARTNAVTRAWFASAATREQGALAADLRAVAAGEVPDSAAAARLSQRAPLLNATLRTTCVTTMIEGGHARNALPQLARATVNCRILPGEDPAQVLRTLRALVADSAVELEVLRPPVPSPPTPLPAALQKKIEAVAAAVWGPIPVTQYMMTGATDGLALRNIGLPVYGVSGLTIDTSDPADARAHGLDERIGVQAFYEQLEFTYRLLRAL